jgi:N-acetylmuramic acid 6-phosphate etherase
MDLNVDEFLAVASQFQLGGLDTEAQHPRSLHLSDEAQRDLPQAVATLKDVDLLAIERFAAKAVNLPALSRSIAEVWSEGGRIFLCGCGATGRLSLSLELFCRLGLMGVDAEERVIAFMAGGDLALIKAIEKFEDHPEYGARQLEELGFGVGDLLIASTEGGETPWVIGATERAAEISRHRPWFLYCNPDEELIAVAKRSERVIENPRITKLNLAVGPMALAGSTRMQASTVLMAAIGFAMQHQETPAEAEIEVARFLALVRETDFSWMVPFTELEAATYASGGRVLYEPGAYGITVLTDTTERSPTFTLRPFENQLKPEEIASWCHLHLSGTSDAHSAWRALLMREPRPLEWEGISETAGSAVLEGYDFSDQLIEKRRVRTNGQEHLRFSIEDTADGFVWAFGGLRHEVVIPGNSFFMKNLLLKLLLNTHSTLIMGRLGRYLDNLMTFVKPSNLKLIDRAIRYVRLLLQRRTGDAGTYEAVARQLFVERERLGPEEAIVMKTMQAILEARANPATDA